MPTAPVVHVENDSSTTVKTNFAEYLQGSPLSYQLPSVDCIGIQTKIYGELSFELPVLSDDWNEYCRQKMHHNLHVTQESKVEVQSGN